MATILADRQVESTDYLVKTAGDYQPTDLVECYKASDPTKTEIVQYQANYIVNGENI